MTSSWQKWTFSGITSPLEELNQTHQNYRRFWTGQYPPAQLRCGFSWVSSGTLHPSFLNLWPHILTPLTNKCAKAHHSWTADHQCAFESIKALVISACELPKPGLVLTPDRMQEHEIKCILDAQPCGCRHQYLIQWVGYSPEDNKWLPGRMLKDCKALDQWIEFGGNGSASGQ